MSKSHMDMIHLCFSGEKTFLAREDTESSININELEINTAKKWPIKFEMDGNKFTITGYDGGYGPVLEIETPEGRKFSILIPPGP